MKSAVSAAGTVTMLGAMIGAAFWGALSLGFSPIDDAFLIVGNLAVIGPTSTALALAWTTFDPELYIPVTIMSYHLDAMVHGLSASWMHGENIALHMLNTVLVWRLLTHWSGRGVGAALAAALFAVHPLQAEAVVWLSARKDILMTGFALASLLLFERHLARASRPAFIGSVGLLLLALLSKPSAVLLPVVMALRMAMVNGGGWRGVARLWPFAGVAGTMGAVGVLGKSHVLGLGNPLTTMGLAAQSLVWTVGKGVLLVPLRVSYDVGHPSSVAMAASAAACAVGAYATWRSWKNAPLVTIGLAWFALTLLPPALNLRTGGMFTLAADRYAYLPVIGLLLAVLGAGERWPSKALRQGAAALAGVAALACIPLTRAQTALWASGERLFATSLARQPDAVTTRVALARTLQQQGKWEEAFAVLKEGLRYGDSPLLHIAAGYVYAKAGDVASAKEQFGLAIAMDDKSPDPLYAMGSLLRQTDDAQGAKAHLERAVALDPSFVEARVELARILLGQGLAAEAKAQLETALRWNVSNADAHLLLAQVLQREGNAARAEGHEKMASLLQGTL